MSFFRAVFTGAAATVGGLLVTAGQALTRLGQRLKGLNQPTAQGFQPAPAPAQRAQPGVALPPGSTGVPGFRPDWKSLPPPTGSNRLPPDHGKPAGPGERRVYLDGVPFFVKSSWIANIMFKPFGGVLGAVRQAITGDRLASGANRTYLTQKGDFTLTIIRPSKNNSSGQYTYPRVSRMVMDAMVVAPSKGKFYWWGGQGSPALRSFSNRPLIGVRMRMKTRLGSLGSKNRAQSKAAFRKSGSIMKRHSTHQRTSTTPIRAIPTFRTFK